MKLVVKFQETDNFAIKFSEKDDFKIDFGDYRIVPYVNPYPGPYTVNQSYEDIILQVKDYTMSNNLTVKAASVARAIVTDTLLELIGNFPVEPVV